MQYILSKRFEKSFSKLNKRQKTEAIENIEIFLKDPHNQILNNHKLSGKWSDYRSINVTGDLGAIYLIVNDGLVRFIDIGSHSQLYS